MYIVQIASEIAPIAKVGGLADVMMGLSRELILQGHKVDIIIPKYDCLQTKYLQFTPVQTSQSYFKGSLHENTIWSSPLNGDLQVTFIEPHHPLRFFERGQIYGFPDDIDRFLYFSRACLEYLAGLKETPDIIQIHDWETAAIALLMQDTRFKERFPKTKIVFTIHNLEYQGRCSAFNLDDIGFQGAKEKLQHPRSADLNLMKGGIVFADSVVTVSPTYAKEVMTEEGSSGLYEALLQNKAKFCGILNGLDYKYWNPATDRFCAFAYSAQDIKPKWQNKWHLFDELGMKRSDEKPLIASICRLVPQKGVHLLKYALTHAEENGAQFILLGTAHDPELIKEFNALEEQYRFHPDIRIVLKNEEALAHRVYAASDMFVVPSIFEPCGLTQMIALRYGSVPIVRRTGGLADTVVDVDTSKKSFKETNGFIFDAPNSEEMMAALMRAHLMWKEKKKEWQELVLQGMHWDYSWGKPTEMYMKIYTKLAN